LKSLASTKLGALNRRRKGINHSQQCQAGKKKGRLNGEHYIADTKLSKTSVATVGLFKDQGDKYTNRIGTQKDLMRHQQIKCKK
jgi:hypothetical protein